MPTAHAIMDTGTRHEQDTRDLHFTRLVRFVRYRHVAPGLEPHRMPNTSAAHAKIDDHVRPEVESHLHGA